MDRGHKVIYAEEIYLCGRNLFMQIYAGTSTAVELQKAIGMWNNKLAEHGERMSRVIQK